MYTFLEYLGILGLIIVCYKLVKSILLLSYFFLAPLLRLNIDLEKMGKWAGWYKIFLCFYSFYNYISNTLSISFIFKRETLFVA